MATKHDSACLQNAGDDEPIFVLRGTDKTAPDTIRHWVKLNKFNEKMPRAKLNEALRVAEEMERLPNRKLPD